MRLERRLFPFKVCVPIERSWINLGSEGSQDWLQLPRFLYHLGYLTKKATSQAKLIKLSFPFTQILTNIFRENRNIMLVIRYSSWWVNLLSDYVFFERQDWMKKDLLQRFLLSFSHLLLRRPVNLRQPKLRPALTGWIHRLHLFPQIGCFRLICLHHHHPKKFFWLVIFIVV